MSRYDPNKCRVCGKGRERTITIASPGKDTLAVFVCEVHAVEFLRRMKQVVLTLAEPFENVFSFDVN